MRASEPEDGRAASAPLDSGVSAGDVYASIVFGGCASEPEPETGGCAACGLPVTTSAREHAASVAHQIGLAHSHPPSALDRTRMGLRTLQAHGWDPDARRGLGRDGAGVLFPLKPAAKEDRLGVGAGERRAAKQRRAEQRPHRLTAEETRAAEARERRRAQWLQAKMFGSVDVERYLRGDSSDNG